MDCVCEFFVDLFALLWDTLIDWIDGLINPVQA